MCTKCAQNVQRGCGGGRVLVPVHAARTGPASPDFLRLAPVEVAGAFRSGVRAGRPAQGLSILSSPDSVTPRWYSQGMVRTLDLARWAGRWVALDENDEVQADADTLKALMVIVDADGLEGVSIMRAPAPGEPVVYGLG